MGIAQIAGMDVGYCYSDGTVYGNQTAVLVILMCKTVLQIHGACADPPVLFPHAAACGVSLEAGFTAGVSGCYCGDTDRFLRSLMCGCCFSPVKFSEQQYAWGKRITPFRICGVLTRSFIWF